MAARITFNSATCNGNVELPEDIMERFQIAGSVAEATAFTTIDQPPEAGGPVAIADKDPLLRIRLLSAALYHELQTQFALNPGAELKAAIVHAEKADHWAVMAFRKDRMLGTPKAPAPASAFPEKKTVSTIKRQARK